MTHVPFKELPQLYTAVATGEVDWAFGSAATVGPLYKAKKVRLLAYAGPKRMAGYTDVPTVAESGGPAGFELSTWVAIFAPKGTPRPAIDRIQSGVAKALADADIKDRLANFGFEPWIAPPADVTKAIEADKLPKSSSAQKFRSTKPRAKPTPSIRLIHAPQTLSHRPDRAQLQHHHGDRDPGHAARARGAAPRALYLSLQPHAHAQGHA
jgi:hypothetical protein